MRDKWISRLMMYDRLEPLSEESKSARVVLIDTFNDTVAYDGTKALFEKCLEKRYFLVRPKNE